MYKKNFYKWNKVKVRLENKSHKVYVRVGEIRWVVFGVNIGSEIDGKGNHFTRPALIVGMVSSKLVLIVPMTTNLKDIRGKIILDWRFGPSALNINQIKTVSTKRILDRVGRISENRLRVVKREIKDFYQLDI